MGFEPTPSTEDQNLSLAPYHSAILTLYKLLFGYKNVINSKQRLPTDADLARVSGDAFTIWMPDIARPQQVTTITS